MTSQNYVKSYHLKTSKTLKKLCEAKQFCLKEKFWQITSLLKTYCQGYVMIGTVRPDLSKMPCKNI